MEQSAFGTPTLEDQLCLLSLDDLSDEVGVSTSDVKDATIFSSDVLKEPDWKAMLPRYGLLGNALPPPELGRTSKKDRRLFLNTYIPWSAFICGVQGSGKSHTMSCLIENCLIPSPMLGTLERPLSALVFYFGEYTSRSNFQPCEAAFLSSPSPEFGGFTAPLVNVLASPSNTHNLRNEYTKIAGVNVKPLKLQPGQLNISSMLALMSVDQSHSSSLYMAQVVTILRGMAAEGSNEFDFIDFKNRLKRADFNDMQRRSLNQRMEILESFLDLDGNSSSCFNFKRGTVTIVDLSCPFMDVNTACVLFKICMGVYLGSSGPDQGKIIALDEAHKYLTNTTASKALTESILGVIRQQRHYGTRIIVSTQEPTVSPNLIDLCSMVMIHRFTSPAWFNVLRKRIPTEETDGANLFTRIVSLRTGEALVFSPVGLVNHRDNEKPVRLNVSPLKIKVRKRLTIDGGKSIVCG